MKRMLLIGNTGQVGWELERTLAPLGQVVSIDYPAIDLADTPAVRQLIRQVNPDVIVNAAAYTAVDRAEREPELARAINGTAPGVLAEIAQELDAAFIHYSTDYVFAGDKGAAYVESDPPNPINEYGRSKLVGELAVQEAGGAYLVLRTSWVYSTRRDSFVTKVLAWSRKNPVLRVVTDQTSSPTWCRMLAEATAQVLAMGGAEIASWLAERRGIYHLAGAGSASRFAWAQAILAMDPHADQQVTHEMQPALSREFPTPATRPVNSALNCNLFSSTFGIHLPHWKEALRLAMDSG